MSQDVHGRWLANMKAAGIEPDAATLARVTADIEERQATFLDLLERLDFRSHNPDYLRDTDGKEHANDDA